MTVTEILAIEFQNLPHKPKCGLHMTVTEILARVHVLIAIQLVVCSDVVHVVPVSDMILDLAPNLISYLTSDLLPALILNLISESDVILE